LTPTRWALTVTSSQQKAYTDKGPAREGAREARGVTGRTAGEQGSHLQVRRQQGTISGAAAGEQRHRGATSGGGPGSKGPKGAEGARRTESGGAVSEGQAHHGGEIAGGNIRGAMFRDRHQGTGIKGLASRSTIAVAAARMLIPQWAGVSGGGDSGRTGRRPVRRRLQPLQGRYSKALD